MPFPRAVQAVVFDMDGLLVDSECAWRDAMMEAAVARGRELPLPVFLSLIGGSRARTREILSRHFGRDFDLDAYLLAADERAHAILDARDCLKAGAREILDALEAEGTPRALCTSSGMAAVERHLGRSGLLPRFQAMVTRESVLNGKPHPEPYLKAATALAVAPEHCLALEDSHNGVRSAAAAGMMTVMAPDLLAATEEIRALCLHVVADLHEALALLKR